MNPILKLAGLAGAGVTATALLAAPANASTAGRHDGVRTGPVFVQTDSSAGNTIVAYDRTDSGRLVQAGTYPTGGLGGTLAGAVVDKTASQGALTYDRRAGLLYAVNPGSNTITTFAVHGDRLTRHQVVSSGGTFPVSIATHGNLVYVLNARDGGSIQGYVQVFGVLVRIPAWHRSLGLDPQKTPEFTSTPGQVAFTPDGSKLVVTTKNGSNSIDVFGVGPSGPSAQPTVTSLPNAVPFAVTFDANDHLVLSEAGPNAVATFDIDRAGKLTQLDSALTGQAATCWIVSVDGKLYLSNAGSGSVSGYTVDDAGALGALGNTHTDGGTVDAAVSPDGRNLYVQTGAAGLVDAFRIEADGALTAIGSVTVPDAAGGEGIVAL